MSQINFLRQFHFASIRMINRQPHLSILALVLFTNVVLYLPSLNAYFISDDFAYVSYLILNIKSLLDGYKWDIWFIGGIDGYLYFRPLGHALMLLDFLAWNLTPFGYHLTNILLHILATFEIYLLGWLITRRQTVGVVAALLFTSMPIHSGAVSWIAARYDVLAGLWCFSSLVFFVLYQRKKTLRLRVISLAAFALGLASKETALTLPLGVLLYDLLFNPDSVRNPLELVKRHLPYWLLAGIRLIFFGHGYQAFQINPDSWWHWVDGNLLNVIAPLSEDLTAEFRWLLIGIFILLLFGYRSRPETVFGLLWIPLTAVANILSGPSDRSFYIPSFGLALALAGILSRFLGRTSTFKMAGMAALFVLMAGYASNLYWRNQDIQRAGEIAQAIPTQVRVLHPTLPAGARLVFVGVPDKTPKGSLVYITGFPGFLPMLYADASPQIFRVNKFPIWLDKLDGTFFFEVDHRRVIERHDLINALEQRKQCADLQIPSLSWDFSNSVQGWEAWNQLAEFEVRDQALHTRSLGTDPYMASPRIDIPAIAIGDIEITMRVRADSPTAKGALYWLASGQQDFSPHLQESFKVQADGEFHALRVDIAKSGKLLIGDRILQLRLDPVDAPADIAIKSIRVFVHCPGVEVERCICSR